MPLSLHHGIEVLTLSGPPGEMGREHGRVLGERLRFGVKEYLRRSAKAFEVPYDLLCSEARRCDPFIPEPYREEMTALAEAANVDYTDVLALNCLVDVDAFVTQRLYHCCNFVLGPPATAGGLFVHGRNLDFPHLGVLPRSAIVIVRDACPARGRAGLATQDAGQGARLSTLAVTWAGCVGVLTGANRARITLAEVGSPAAGATPDGVPAGFLLRKALEESTSLDEVYGVLRIAHRTCGLNVAVADGKSGAACAIELTPRLCARRFLRNGVLVVDDVALCGRTARNRLCHPAGAFRHARMMHLVEANHGQIDEEAAVSFLRDRYDAARGVARGRGYHCICNNHTLQSVLFFPGQERMLLSHGHTPAPVAPYQLLNLAELWAGSWVEAAGHQ